MRFQLQYSAAHLELDGFVTPSAARRTSRFRGVSQIGYDSKDRVERGILGINIWIGGS